MNRSSQRATCRRFLHGIVKLLILFDQLGQFFGNERSRAAKPPYDRVAQLAHGLTVFLWHDLLGPHEVEVGHGSTPCPQNAELAGKARQTFCDSKRAWRKEPAGYFNSTDQYAFSRNVRQDWYFRWVSFRFRSGLRFGFSGLRIRLMCASLGVRPPLRTLQLTQAQTMLSQVLWPPWLRGSTWSRLSSEVGCLRPQYWHWLLSRAKILRRLNFTVCLGSLS